MNRHVDECQKKMENLLSLSKGENEDEEKQWTGKDECF
jgi:hypothetical protein